MAETQLLRILGMGQLYDGERNPRLVVNCISVMDVIWQYMKENIFAFFNLKKQKKKLHCLMIQVLRIHATSSQNS